MTYTDTISGKYIVDLWFFPKRSFYVLTPLEQVAALALEKFGKLLFIGVGGGGVVRVSDKQAAIPEDFLPASIPVRGEGMAAKG